MRRKRRKFSQATVDRLWREFAPYKGNAVLPYIHFLFYDNPQLSLELRVFLIARALRPLHWDFESYVKFIETGKTP